jgi:ribosomal protein L24
MPGLKIRKNDTVEVISGERQGDAAGASSRSFEALAGPRRRGEQDQAPHEAEPPEKRQGRHRRAREIPVHVSNVALIDRSRQADAVGPR